MRSRTTHVRRSAIVLGVGCGVFAAAAFAADHPVGGDVLRLRDPALASGRRAQFRASQDPAIVPTAGADPRLTGATLEITGEDVGDGATGSIDLPAGGWSGLGKPKGAKGYVYLNRTGTQGVRKVAFRTGGRGGTLAVAARGSGWPYVVTQAQAAVGVRLTVADDVYCARFTSFTENRAGRVFARLAPPPAACGTGATCGNGTLEGSEECDDGNTTGGDGCSAACVVENPGCGDGVATGSEECDDGNTTGGDGCDAGCRLEHTGARCAGVPAVAGTALDTVRIASGLSSPLHAAAPPLDPSRLFVVEQGGRVRVIRNGTLLATPFLDIAGRVSCCNERGLLGIAFHPAYETNGRFFLYYTDTAFAIVIARYQVTADPDVADPASERILLTIPHPGAANHNGGQLAFGPDGFLYVGTGDGGGGGDPFENAQDPGSLLGKLLRLDVNVEAAPYHRVPPSNPFVGPGDPRDEIWATGLRNPWRFSFDRATGDLYIGDVGQGDREEIDLQPAASPGGENYGWDVFEGSLCFEPTPPASQCPNPPTGFTMPVFEYAHAAGFCGGSVTGGFSYRGCRLPDLHGTYFHADFCTGTIRSFRGVVGGVAQNTADRTAELAPGGGLAIGGVSSFAEDARGELYLVDYDGEVYKIVPGT